MRTTFSSEQIAKLEQNPCVFRCGQGSIHYTYEFKKRALDLYAQGIKSDEIWKQAGFDISIWKKDYCRYTIKDWRRMIKKGGLESLTRPSGVQADGGYKRARSPEADRVRRLEEYKNEATKYESQENSENYEEIWIDRHGEKKESIQTDDEEKPGAQNLSQ